MKRLRFGRFTFVMLAMAAVLPGCKHSPSQYVAPRVTGRVVDVQTRLPVPDVLVQRLGDNRPPSAVEPVRGAETLARSAGERTKDDGSFAFGSESGLAFFRKLRWYSVTLVFSRAGYEGLTREYSSTDAITTSSGEPWINAGDVLLIPKTSHRVGSIP
jgi:hypothetical protein